MIHVPETPQLKHAKANNADFLVYSKVVHHVNNMSPRGSTIQTTLETRRNRYPNFCHSEIVGTLLMCELIDVSSYPHIWFLASVRCLT